jgi:hypothetical protein
VLQRNFDGHNRLISSHQPQRRSAAQFSFPRGYGGVA